MINFTGHTFRLLCLMIIKALFYIILLCNNDNNCNLLMHSLFNFKFTVTTRTRILFLCIARALYDRYIIMNFIIIFVSLFFFLFRESIQF